jgi:hypothetical protein
VLWKLLGKYIATLFPLVFRFLCESSGRCVLGRPDGYLVCLDGDSGCPDDTVVSSGCSWFLSGRPCFYDLLRGTKSGRHLCSNQTVNPVGLNPFLLAPQPTFSPLLFFFFSSSCTFSLYFLCIVLTCTCRLWILSPPQLYSCTLLLIYFKLSMIKISCFWVSTILSLLCIIPQNWLLVGLRLCLFGSL